MSRLEVVIVVGGGDSEAFGGCQVQKEAREAQRYTITHNVSYAEAARQIGGTIRQSEGDNRVQTWIRDLLRNHAHTNVISKDTLIVNQIDFMAFIGKVINLTAFVQTAKLMIIVEAATEFLGVTDVTVAMIVDMLTPNNTNDGMSQYDK
jgi:hypothetical protein